MPQYVERTYRRTTSPDLVTFQVKVAQTDLLIAAQCDLSAPAASLVRRCHADLEGYIERDPPFAHALHPRRAAEDAPEIAHEMAQAAALAGVGPMAAVAGAIAEWVGRGLAPCSSEVIVENGGDLWLQGSRDRIVGVFAGQSPFTGRLGLRVTGDLLPLAVCASSGTVGPSLSFGRADAAIAVAGDGALADAAATALGNAVRSKDDIGAAIRLAQRIPGVMGVVIIIGEHLGAWGRVELVQTNASGT